MTYSNVTGCNVTGRNMTHINGTGSNGTGINVTGSNVTGSNVTLVVSGIAKDRQSTNKPVPCGNCALRLKANTHNCE